MTFTKKSTLQIAAASVPVWLLLAYFVGGRDGAAGATLGIAGSAFNLWALKAGIALLAQEPQERLAKFAAAFVVVAFFAKVPVLYGLWLVAKHLGEPGPPPLVPARAWSGILDSGRLVLSFALMARLSCRMGDLSGIYSFPLTLAEQSGEHEGPTFIGLAVYVGFVLLVLFGLMVFAKKGLNNRVFKNPVTSLFEQVYLFIQNMTVGIIGSHGRKYIPMIMTLWMIIFSGNVLALFFAASPTADLSFNLAMALISVFYVQYEGMKSNGIFGHFKHFAGPKLGIALIPITLMIFVIEIISELMKNVSLSLRLYGNMHGGHMAVEAMNKMGDKFYVPFGDFLLPIKLLTCVVQAMIFTLLTCVYISLVTHHDEDHGEEAMHSLEPAHVAAG